MLRWINRILEAGADLLDVKARLAMRSVERVGVVLVGYLTASLMILLGCGTLLAAAVVLLAPVVGAGLALLIVGAGAAGVGAVVILVFHVRGPNRPLSRQELEHEEAVAQQEFSEAIQGKTSSHAGPQNSPKSGDAPSETQRLVAAALANPGATAGAAFALISVLGFKRAIRLVSAGATLVGLYESMHHSEAGDEQGAAAPSPPPPPSRHADPTQPAPVKPPNGQWFEARDHRSHERVG